MVYSGPTKVMDRETRLLAANPDDLERRNDLVTRIRARNDTLFGVDEGDHVPNQDGLVAGQDVLVATKAGYRRGRITRLNYRGDCAWRGEL